MVQLAKSDQLFGAGVREMEGVREGEATEEEVRMGEAGLGER